MNDEHSAYYAIVEEDILAFELVLMYVAVENRWLGSLIISRPNHEQPRRISHPVRLTSKIVEDAKEELARYFQKHPEEALRPVAVEVSDEKIIEAMALLQQETIRRM